MATEKVTPLTGERNMIRSIEVTPDVKAQQDDMKQHIITLINRPDVFIYGADYGDLDIGSDISLQHLALTYQIYDKVTIKQE